MADVTVLPPIRFLPDITVPFTDPIDVEVYLESIANPLIVNAIRLAFPGIPVSVDLNGDINVAGVAFSSKFNLCPLICPPGLTKSPIGTCECPIWFIKVGNICVCPEGSELKDGECVKKKKDKVCPPNFILRNGECFCPPGHTLLNGVCSKNKK